MCHSRTLGATEFVRRLFQEAPGSHDLQHALRVWRTAMALAETEPNCDREIVSLAALLHDADDPKLFHTEKNANARRCLAELGVSPEETERICATINSVSFSKNRGRKPDTLEGAIVQDADRLDAMGAVGVARTFAYGGEHGRPLEASVAHFHEKLLLLADEMNTAAARETARERHAFLEAFLREYERETSC